MKLDIILSKILTISLILFLLFLPFSRSGHAFGVMMSLLIWVTFVLSRRTYRGILQGIIPKLALIFISFLLLSTVINGINWFSLDGLRRILTCVALYFVVYQSIEDINKLNTAIYVFLISCTLASMHSIIKYFVNLFTTNPQQSHLLYRAQGMIDTNSLAGVIEMAIPIFLSLALFHKTRLFLWIGLILNCICLGLTFTRGAWLGVAVSTCSVIYLRYRKLSYAVLLVSFLVLVLLIWPSGRRRLFGSLKLETETERVTMWKYAFKMFETKPLFGHGPNSFRKAVMSSLVPVDAGHKHCHNIYLGLAAETGLFSLVAFLLLSFYAIGSVIRKIIQGLTLWEDYLALGCIGSIISFLTHGFVDYTLYGETGFMYGFLMGIVSVYVQDKQK